MNMSFSRPFGGMPQVRTWQDALGLLQAGRKELQKNAGIMTEYERLAASRSIEGVKEAYYQTIKGGALGEYNQALDGYQAARNRLERARAKEAARWDAARLRDEMQLAEMLFTKAKETRVDAFAQPGSPSAADEIERIYQEAQASGDIYKRRAVAEAIRGLEIGTISGNDPVRIRERGRLEALKKQSAQDLAAVRVTDEMIAADNEISARWNEFSEKRQQLITVGQELDGSDPTGLFAAGDIARAIRRVQVDQGGEVRILAPDNPEVTGIEMP
jgi:hypothetical protein